MNTFAPNLLTVMNTFAPNVLILMNTFALGLTVVLGANINKKNEVHKFVDHNFVYRCIFLGLNAKFL